MTNENRDLDVSGNYMLTIAYQRYNDNDASNAETIIAVSKEDAEKIEQLEHECNGEWFNYNSEVILDSKVQKVPEPVTFKQYKESLIDKIDWEFEQEIIDRKTHDKLIKVIANF